MAYTTLIPQTRESFTGWCVLFYIKAWRSMRCLRQKTLFQKRANTSCNVSSRAANCKRYKLARVRACAWSQQSQLQRPISQAINAFLALTIKCYGRASVQPRLFSISKICRSSRNARAVWRCRHSARRPLFAHYYFLIILQRAGS